VFVSLAYPGLRDHSYDWQTHLVSAAKFAWYAPLALVVPLLVSRRADAVLLFKAVVVTSYAASAWAILQFIGLVPEFEGKRPGQREPSFVGIHDFAVVSAAALLLGIAGLAFAHRRPLPHGWSIAALATGALGLVLSGAMTGVAGAWLAAAAILLFARRYGTLSLRPALATLAILLIVTAGAATMRASAIERFAEFIGLRAHEPDERIQSYAHRTLLAYIGVKIFLDHPVTGAGWQASNEQWAYGPHLGEAHRRFPSEPDEAFPSPQRPWGVQNLYVETLADLGVVGFAVLAVLFGLGVAAALRGAATTELAVIGLAWLFVLAGVWVGVGLIPGLPMVALTWMTLGLVTVRV
jgi:O-antigen ligase